MGKKIKFDDIKAGDVVTVQYTVQEVDPGDTSFYGAGGEHLQWVYPAKDTVIRRVKPKKSRLIPKDAEFVLWTYRGVQEVFWKKEDGSWKSEDDEYGSTKDLEWAFKNLQRAPEGDPDSTLVVLDRRAS